MRNEARQLSALRATIDGTADATADLLRREAIAAGYWLSADGRIGESDLAALLGITSGALANRRREGTAPPAFNLGGGGHRITYRLIDAARWLESHRLQVG